MILRIAIASFTAAMAAYAKPVFSVSAASVDVYDFIEVTARVAPGPSNPFVGASLNGELRFSNQQPLLVTGFCDSPDGSVFRIRFLATKPGPYNFAVSFHSADQEARYEGGFTAIASHRRGLVRVDSDHPFHFLWEGTGEHYFWNGLTTYALMGWQDEAYIHDIIDRAARMRVNRLRVSLNGPRVEDASRWYEPVKPSDNFHFLFGPWIGAHPDRVANPGWDVTRYDVAFWQKYERLVRYARERDVIISVIFFLDGEDPGADPFGRQNAFGEDEKQYYRYAAARLSAYSNVMWDITNEWHLFRSAWWVQRMGTYLKSADPWQHLMSCHGRGEFPWMVSFWPDFAMFQLWDEDGSYGPMLQRRKNQGGSGRPMPQVNEEYGYEDHYPVKWGGNRRPPARSADNRRREAWEISMAGCYQTTGERANRGDGHPPATPGGWINGGFDSSMHMLEGYKRMVDFFTSIEYWKLEPAPELITGPLLAMAEPGSQYVLYYRGPETGVLKLMPGIYRARWYNPRSGQWSDAPQVHAESEQEWNAPVSPATGDWVLLLTRTLEPQA